MYNKFLEYLLQNEPEKTISQTGITLRRIMNPVVRKVLPLSTKTELKIIRREKMPNAPVIFAATHGFQEDIVDTLLIADRLAYILIGSLSQIFYSMDGIVAWIAGMILVDRMDQESRKAAKEKMIRVLKMGVSIIIFPEGTWNKSPNQMVSGLFPGVYDVAMATGAPIVPVATHREGKYVYGILDKGFDITKYERQQGISFLRDRMATLRWELMEIDSFATRDEFPYGERADVYWTNYIDKLMTEVEFYDYEIELNTKYVDKLAATPEEVFAFMKNIQLTKNNAFLWRQ